MSRVVWIFLAWVAWAAPAAALQPLEVFKDCETCPEMVVMPTGSFVMGMDEGAYKYEIPAHKVTIAKPYAIGKYEVTFDEWEACHAAGGCDKNPHDHNWGRGRRPVINITIADAEQYTAWLSKTTGQVYRLPSEAEWEYAARAGTTTQFYWGDKVGENRANCRDCKSEWSKKSSGPVGSFPANPWGLHDMHGNIWEWMAECWHANYIGAPTDGSVWQGGNCKYRAMRSGSWYYFNRNTRSSWRFKNDVRVNSYGIGIRMVREIP